MMDKLLKLLSKNAKLTNEELAQTLGISLKEVEQKIEEYKQEGIIRGYKVLLDYSRVETDYVMAFIELKVTPRATYGFDEIARSIMQFPQVDSVYLLSGGYDLSVVVTAQSFKEICVFVSNCLSQMEGVISTRTNFVLSKYLENGIVTCEPATDERGQ